MDRLQNSDSFGFKVQGAHFLKPNAVTQTKRKMESSGNVFQASHKDAAHFVSMSSSKFGANILGQMNSVEQVNAVNQGDFSGYMNDRSAGHMKKVSQKPSQKLSPHNEYASNFINQFDLTSDEPNMFNLIGVQKLQLGHEDKPIPVNYDKKKARKKFDSKSPTQEGVEQPKIGNQHVVVANDASFFSQPKRSIDKSNDDKKSLFNQSFKQGKSQVERFNEQTYNKSPTKVKTKLYDHNLQKATMGDSTAKGNYKNISGNNELEDMSEFNNSLKMSINKPIYSGGNTSNSIKQPKHNFGQLQSLPLRNSGVTLGGQDDPMHQASLATTQLEPNSHLNTQEVVMETLQAQNIQIKFLELKRFIFQLDNIVEFCADDAADVDTIIMMLEQCLFRKVYLNAKSLSVSKLKNCCEFIVQQVDQELNVRAVAGTDIETQENCLKKDFSKNIQVQVKQLIRDYFKNLAVQEAQQQKMGSEAPKTGKNSKAETINTPFNGQTHSIGIAAQSSFDVSHLNQMTDGQMQMTLEAPDGQASLDQDNENEVPTQPISPEGGDVKNEIGTEDPTLQKIENSASEADIEPMEGKMDQTQEGAEALPNNYLLDEDLEELEQIQSGGDADNDQINIDLIKLQKGVEFAELEQQLEKLQGGQEQTGEKKKGTESINEIIVKIEMKKFQNLINNRLQRKNNLVSTDINRVFPLNKLADGSARQVEVISGFHEGLLKMNPKLFPYYEKINRKVKKEAQSLVEMRRSVSPQSKAFSQQKNYEQDTNQFNQSLTNTRVMTNDNSKKSFMPTSIPTTSYGVKRDSLIQYARANQSPPPQTAHQIQRVSLGQNNKRRSQQLNAWRHQAYAGNQDLNYEKQRKSFEQFQTLSMNSKKTMISSLNNQNVGLKKTLGAQVGVAGKRQPTTYVVNETGDIGVIQQEENQGVISPMSMSMKDRKIYEHDRTISEFAQRHISKAQKLKLKAEEESLSHHERKQNLNMPLLQTQSGHSRQRSMQQHYNNKPVALTAKNKYGLNIPCSVKGGNFSNLANSQSLTLGSQRQTLAQKYRIPERGQHMLDSSRQSTMSDRYGLQSILFNNDSESNVEPFGWKIGLKDRQGPYHEQQARQQHQRHLQLLRNQKRQQENLQNGIDKLTNNQFYRQMYEKFKDRQSKYPNELARILTEDCKPETNSAVDSTRESQADFGLEKNPIKRLAKQGQN